MLSTETLKISILVITNGDIFTNSLDGRSKKDKSVEAKHTTVDGETQKSSN